MLLLLTISSYLIKYESSHVSQTSSDLIQTRIQRTSIAILQFVVQLFLSLSLFLQFQATERNVSDKWTDRKKSTQEDGNKKEEEKNLFGASFAISSRFLEVIGRQTCSFRQKAINFNFCTRRSISFSGLEC